MSGTLQGSLREGLGVSGFRVVQNQQARHPLSILPAMVELVDIQQAAARIEGQIVRTPCPQSRTLSAATGADVYLKFENLQFTASFKERGALNRLLQLPASQAARGVAAMSAGNHAQALAYHGARLDIPVTIVMPVSTPNAKVEATRVHGAEVLLHGDQFDATRCFTEDLARERGLTLVHPFDDPAVIAGQGTVALELLSQVENLDAVIVPVGGGGLLSGMATAGKALAPDVRWVGVQAERYSGVVRALGRCAPDTTAGSTVAEGIAVKAPGANTLPLLAAHVDEMLTVSEQAIEQAVFTLLEVEKTVTEGAGAAGFAALQSHREQFAGQRVAVVLSGGNIDMMILSSILQRGLVRSERLVRLLVEIPDLPGALGDLTRVIGAAGANIVELAHQRAFAGSTVRTTVIDVALQLRGSAQLDQLLGDLYAQGYEVRKTAPL